MSRSRRELSDVYEAQDLIIAAAQDVKREATKAYRDYLDGRGMDKDAVKAEVEAFKKAFRRKMDGQKKGTEAVEHVDAIADEIYLEITAPRAPRATRVENIEEFDAETGEIKEPQLTKAAGQAEHRDPVALSGERGAATSSVENEAAEISTPIQSETANEARDEIGHVAVDAAGHGWIDAGDGADNHNPGGEDVDAPDVPATHEDVDGALDVAGATGKSVEASASAAPAQFDARKLRPDCQQPFACRGMGREHCFRCKKAKAESEAA